MLGVHFDEEDSFEEENAGNASRPQLHQNRVSMVVLKDKFGHDYNDVFRKFDVENIELLPTIVADFKVDFRYFLVAAGLTHTSNIPIFDDRCFIDDIDPPLRKHFSIPQYFKYLERTYQTPENFMKYGVNITLLAQFYLGYKQGAMGAGELLNEFCGMLGTRHGFTCFWGLAVCHTSSHNIELNEVIRRSLFKLKFQNGDCVVNHAAPVPHGKTDQDGRPVKPIIKYTFVYNLLTDVLEKHIRERSQELGEMDIRSLNQAISTIYELDKHDLL